MLPVDMLSVLMGMQAQQAQQAQVVAALHAEVLAMRQAQGAGAPPAAQPAPVQQNDE
jgi:hypothetical protein